MYQALYRKWRPKTFDDVVGQPHITETLKRQVHTGRLSHAYLFIGTRGTGKTTCAKILAKAVNCEHPVDGNPCNQCAACRGIDDGSVLDVVELDAASNNGVDNVRALRDEAVFSPANVKKRVYIVDEVHMLSTAAFNALLKILEEPPEHLMFILATTELHKVPATILSRCQRHSFKRIPPELIAARLSYVAGQEQIDLQPDAATLLARLADGGMRDALTLLDQCSGSEHVTTEAVLSAMGLAGHLRTAALLRQIAAGETEQALSTFRALWQDGKDPASLLDELSMLQRDALLRSVAARGGSALLSGSYDTATLDEFVKTIGTAQLLANLTAIQDALAGMTQSANPRLTAELCIIRLCRPALQTDLPALTARVAALEWAVQRGAPIQSAHVTSAPEPPPEPEAEPEPQPAPNVETPPEPEIEPDPEPIPPPPAVDERPLIPEEPPAPDNLSVPAAPAAPEAPDAASDSIWSAICAELQRTLSAGQSAPLLDALQVQGTLEADVLTVRLEQSFVYPMFNTPDMTERFRAAAEKCAGRPIRVVLQPMDVHEQINQRSVEELAQFGNVTIR